MEPIVIPVISGSQAARAVARRVAEGSAHTGWSAAWLINIYARSYMFGSVLTPRVFALHTALTQSFTQRWPRNHTCTRSNPSLAQAARRSWGGASAGASFEAVHPSQPAQVRRFGHNTHASH